MKAVVIVGSARQEGNTKKVAVELASILSCDLIDLTDFRIAQYNYENEYTDDDFLPLIKRVIGTYDTIIYATPVYWYSMSSSMKIFFDRLTDLLEIEKDHGRLLRGKSTATISSSNGSNLGDAFWLPFSHTSEYLGMNYLGGLHTFEDKDPSKELLHFSKEIIQKHLAISS